jgi:peroxiredoxin
MTQLKTRRTMNSTRMLALLLACVPLACKSAATSDAAKEAPATAAAPGPTPAATETTALPQDSAKPAALGELAPDFTLPDLDGKPVHLADHRGKIVVLEWFNPECPFVKASHLKGSLVDAAKKATESGVVWLAINSGAPGKQGHGVERNREGKAKFNLTHPILLDETGKIGKLYGATRTPHLYVINREGKLVYRGAVDNSPDGEADSPKGGTLVRYVDDAIAAVAANKPVAAADTEAYGCSVKYAN